MTTPTTDPLAQVAERIRALEAENARLRADQENKWKLQSEVGELREKLRRADEERKRLVDANERHYTNERFWRKAMRYEQQMKKPPRKVRHLPVYNGVKRGQYRTPEWTNRERIFLKHWRKDNKGTPGINGGFGILELILSNDINGTPADISQRDAQVAATVVQWLGTNCGYAFLHDVNREIEASDKRKRAARVA